MRTVPIAFGVLFMSLALWVPVALAHEGDHEHAVSAQEQAVLDEAAQAAASSPPVLTDVRMADAFNFDPTNGETGLIRYRLTAPARVRIVVGHIGDSDAAYRVLFWDRQPKGTYKIPWDGKDAQGHPLDMTKCSIWIQADPQSGYKPGTADLKPLRVADLPHHHGPHMHNTHDADKCSELKLQLGEMRIVQAPGESLPLGGLKVAPKDGATVKGRLRVTVTIPIGSRGYGDISGYGSRWMIDSERAEQLFFEAECNGVLVWEVDTSAFADGKHVLSVSVCDHYDHIGTTSVVLNFRNSR